MLANVFEYLDKLFINILHMLHKTSGNFTNTVVKFNYHDYIAV